MDLNNITYKDLLPGDKIEFSYLNKSEYDNKFFEIYKVGGIIQIIVPPEQHCCKYQNDIYVRCLAGHNMKIQQLKRYFSNANT